MWARDACFGSAIKDKCQFINTMIEQHSCSLSNSEWYRMETAVNTCQRNDQELQPARLLAHIYGTINTDSEK